MLVAMITAEKKPIKRITGMEADPQTMI